MNNYNRPNFARAIFTTVALAFEILHLGLEYMDGGVQAHHLLARPDLPAISNWWGLLLVPALAWSLSGRVAHRIRKQNPYDTGTRRVSAAIMIAFTASLAYGAALSLAFITSFEGISYIFLGAFAVSLLVPTYRAEYILGFVMGMSFTFGAVLPTIVALVIASFSRIVHLAYSAAVRVIRRSATPRPL